MVGELAYNLRSALDRVTWRLALRTNHGKEPSDKEAPKIQFPVVVARGLRKTKRWREL